MKSFSIFLLGALALVHCGDDSSDGTGNSNQAIVVNESNFAQVLLDSICKNYAPCCAKVGYQLDGLSCTMNASLFTMSPFQPATSTWNQANAEACIAKVNAKVAACEDDLFAIPECLRAREAPTEPGQECGLSTQCRLTTGALANCKSVEFDGPRVCWQVVQVGLGEACTDDAQTFTERSCMTKHGQAVACTDGICKEQTPPACSGPCKADGEACAGAQDCANSSCVRGICGPTTAPNLLCKP